MKCRSDDCTASATVKLILLADIIGDNKGVVIVRGPYCDDCLALCIAVIVENKEGVAKYFSGVARNQGATGDVDERSFRFQIAPADTDLDRAVDIVQIRRKAVLN